MKCVVCGRSATIVTTNKLSNDTGYTQWRCEEDHRTHELSKIDSIHDPDPGSWHSFMVSADRMDILNNIVEEIKNANNTR